MCMSLSLVEVADDSLECFSVDLRQLLYQGLELYQLLLVFRLCECVCVSE